jgi:hypothetical protein
MSLSINTEYMVPTFGAVTMQSLCKFWGKCMFIFSSNTRSSTVSSVSRPSRCRSYGITLRHATLVAP